MFRTAICCVMIAANVVAISAQQRKRDAPPPPLPLVPAEQAWLTMLDALPAAGGAMDDARVYIPLQSARVIALDRRNGATVWSREIETTRPPVVAAGVVYVAAPEGIRALDPATGAERWRVALARPVIAPMGASRGMLFAAIEPGELAAVTLATGTLAWQAPLGAATRFAPVVQDDRVYLSLDDGRIVALSASNGAQLWERRLSGTLGAPAVAGDRVLVGSDSNEFFALDRDSGRERWTWRAGGDVVGATADGDDHVVFASLDNLLRSVNRGNGNQRWLKSIPSRPASPPQAIGNVIVVSGVSPTIYAYDARDGNLVGTFTAPAELEGPPLIDRMLTPFQVAMVVITRNGPVAGVYPTAMLFREPPIAPLSPLPGLRLGREPAP